MFLCILSTAADLCQLGKGENRKIVDRPITHTRWCTSGLHINRYTVILDKVMYSSTSYLNATAAAPCPFQHAPVVRATIWHCLLSQSCAAMRCAASLKTFHHNNTCPQLRYLAYAVTCLHDSSDNTSTNARQYTQQACITWEFMPL